VQWPTDDDVSTHSDDNGQPRVGLDAGVLHEWTVDDAENTHSLVVRVRCRLMPHGVIASTVPDGKRRRRAEQVSDGEAYQPRSRRTLDPTTHDSLHTTPT